ncbi:MAG: Bacterial extracellular solute-binding protein [Candidatus Izimaplasma bacterium HR2]|nr:MAG: Bacterial extracellular solute-binding protein [Candidatus Izimaplasma bacterium HR2]
MKKIIIVLFAVTLVAVLGACGGSDDPTVLVIQSSFVREVSEKEIYQTEIFDAFEEEHNVTIELNTYSEVGNLYDKIKTEQDSGEITSDLVIAHYSDMVNYKSNNSYMMDLDDLEGEMDDRTFLDAFETSTFENGIRYFFPINIDVYIGIAANSAFDHLPTGVTEADVLAGDYTWDDYVAWADGDNVTTFIKGLAASQIIYQIGGMALSHTDIIEGTFPNLNSTANQRAWNAILEMKLNGAIHAESTTVNSAQDLLEAGNVQLAFEHQSVVGLTYAGAPAQFKVFPGPKGDSGNAGTIAGGHGIGIIEGAPNAELAEEFIKWITAPEQIVHAALGSTPPLLEATAALGTSPSDEVVKMGVATLENSNVEGLQMIPNYTDWGGVKGCSDAVFTKIMDGTITTEAQLLAELNTQQANLEALEK